MNKASGFTIIELMVIMAILAITLALGIPQINNVVMDSRRVDALNRLSANLAFARSEAIKRTTAVSLTAGDIAGNNWAPNWHQGWTVYIDTDNDGAFTIGEELREEGSMNLPLNTTITCVAPPRCIGGDIVFSSDGSVNAQITLGLRDTADIDADRNLAISATGRVSIIDPY